MEAFEVRNETRHNLLSSRNLSMHEPGHIFFDKERE